MGVDNFDVLSALNENLARKGNEALASLNNPELCFFHLRGFIGYTLQFLEKQHSIAPLSKADLNKTGADLHRIERLKQWGVPLSRQEERALHDIRKLGNVGSHVADKEHLLTLSNAENGVVACRIVRDWMARSYFEKQPKPERIDPPAPASSKLIGVLKTLNEGQPSRTAIARAQTAPYILGPATASKRSKGTNRWKAWLERGAILVLVFLVVSVAYDVSSRSDVASRTSRTSAASFEKPFSRPAEERPADLRYDFSCSPGYISSGGRCFAIPKGAVDFELSQADMFMLPPGAKGNITVINGGLFVRQTDGVLFYVMAGKTGPVKATDIVKVDRNGTRASFEPSY